MHEYKNHNMIYILLHFESCPFRYCRRLHSQIKGIGDVDACEEGGLEGGVYLDTDVEEGRWAVGLELQANDEVVSGVGLVVYRNVGLAGGLRGVHC